jgi:tetratricopeptide (TPR) repeat protein
MFSVRKRFVLVAFVLALSLIAGTLPASATCGGGGGGGKGGMNPGAGGGGTGVDMEAYNVPWKIIGPADTTPDGALVVYWFPTSPENARSSEVRQSRFLTLSSGQCVGMALVRTDNAPLRTKFSAPQDQPVVVLASKDGTEVGRVAGENGVVKVEEVEGLVKKELSKREDAAKQTLDQAKEKVDAKDADGAAALYQQVYDQRCLLPSEAKKAAKGLKKLGKPVPEVESSRLDSIQPADTSAEKTAEMVRTMRAGVAAEQEGKVVEAKAAYESARRMDPNDPVAARYLAELYRHHTGEWAAAHTLFNRVLSMGADPMSRAVALHGLGKMTIHDGNFAKGLALFDESLRAFPLALTYRNLAVYWNSEHQSDKAYGYVKKALELDPDDEYNQIFAATYLVSLGKPEEAEAVARRHEQMLEASYNLAAIYAQLGKKDQALAMLHRHFFVYEQFDAVRAKEMQEARDDIAFVRYHQDPDFVKLTSGADGLGAMKKARG